MLKHSDVTLLIVDDEESLRRSMARNFKMDNFNVLTAAGGREALEIVKAHKIDFVLSDVRMPDGDGVELLEKIRELDPKIPTVLLVTGFAELSKDEAIEKGAHDLLSKPPDIDLIIEYIEKILNLS